MSQCWAFNQQRQRCDLPSYHEGQPHQFSITWTDDECFDPTQVVTLPVPAPFGGVTLTNRTAGTKIATLRSLDAETGEFVDTEIEVEDDPLSDVCFSCGCLEGEHPCDRHGCRE